MKYVCYNSSVLKEPPEMLQVFWALRPRIYLKGDTSLTLLCIQGKGRLARGKIVLALLPHLQASVTEETLPARILHL